MAEDLILDIDFDITKAEAKQRKLQREFDQSVEKTRLIKEQISAISEKIEKSKQKQADYNAVLDDTSKKLDAYMTGDLQLTDKQLATLQKRNETALNGLEKEEVYQKKQEMLISKQNMQLKEQQAKTANIADKIKLATTNSSKWGEGLKSADKSMAKLGRRIKSLITSALLFSVITKAFTALRNNFSGLLTKEGSKTAALISQIKENLSTIGMTLYQSAAPYITWLLQKLAEITKLLSEGIAKILGKNVNQMKALAKYTKKTGDEAKKSTLGFDTIQIAQGDEKSGGNTSGIGKNVETGINTILGMLLLGGALLVLGVILTFTGVNIPLGLGLIAAGALTIVAPIAAKWDALDQNTKDTIQGILGIGGILLFIVGIALLCFGMIPLGIGLIIAGASAVAYAVSLDPSRFFNSVKMVFENIRTFITGWISWFRVSFLDKCFGTAFGESLQGMFDAWCAIFKNMIDFVDGIVHGDWKKAGKALVNVLIGCLNAGISSINTVIQFFLGGGTKLINGLGKLMGKDWNLNANWAKIPKIPYLATGAVIPGGRPFPAILGDQRAGQTNIEAPLDTIVEAVKLAIGEPKFSIEAKGSMAQLIKMLNLEIQREQNRASLFQGGAR